MPHPLRERLLKTKYHCRGVAVGFRSDQVILPNGNTAVREYLTHPGAVAILPFLDSPWENPPEKCRVVLVQQFRYPVRLITEELPAGKLDGKEALEKCLRRELKEETGYRASRFHRLLSYWPTPAFSDEVIHIYWTENLKAGKSNPDEDEFLKTKIETFANVLKKVRTGKIRDSKTVIGILFFSRFIASSGRVPAGTPGRWNQEREV